jgi:hypothetical protein
MADDIEVRVSVLRNELASDLTVAELGVMLTALNRTLNKLALDSPELREWLPELYYSPIQNEPVFIQLSVTSVRSGSVELQVAIDFLSRIGLDHDTAKTLLIGILANALFDPHRATKIVYDFLRGIKRVSRGALGKTIEMVITIKNAAIRLRAHVSEGGDVEVNVHRSPPDDIQ